METITITTEFIRLQDLMKLANLASSGGEAKMLIQDGQVTVNGEICLQRGKKLRPGDVVNIPAGVKHWHGAAKDSWFQHLAIEVPGEDGRTEWHEPVDDAQYRTLK